MGVFRTANWDWLAVPDQGRREVKLFFYSLFLSSPSPLS